MALNNFIPEIWARSILRALDTSLVYGQPGVINRDYEGEISQQGDTVRINSIGDVEIKSYTKGTDIDAPEELDDAQLTLLIDQGKYFNFAVDDVDKVQGNPETMTEATRRAGYGLRKTADSFLAGKYTDVATANRADAGTALTVGLGASDTNAYELLVDLGVILDNNDVPEEGRWAVIPPWFHGMIRKDDRFVSFGTDANRQALLNGMVGEAAGFRLLKSNQVETSDASGLEFELLAGHAMAWSYAEQILQVEGYRPERRFADAVKGLHVYGAKVVRPYALSVATVADGS